MFILHSSNKTENLLLHLISVIENVPLTKPLGTELFLIQSQGMERWLSQQLASHFGVWGNFEFLFPHKFFTTLAKKIDGKINNEQFDREQMLWRFEQLLRHLDHDSFKPLQHYIQGESKSLKRFQLAQQLAQIFDQYQIMRPDMLNKWAKGQSFYSIENEEWQQILWQRVTQAVGHKHRGLLWQEITQKLNSAKEETLSNCLPERVFIFGLNTMPPLFLDYLQGLSKHCDVHLFLLNPAREYWADLAHKKQKNNEKIAGHPLLSILGQQGREFQQMILEQARFDYEPDSFEEAEASNNLQQLQNDILQNQLQKRTLTNDNSISIHACHSRMREVEVLKQQLLLCLEQQPSLELRHIVVMAPDIQQYAPFISAVFNDIQHAIADKSVQHSNTSLDAFIQFLQLSQGRFGWQGIMDLLQQSVVFAKFSLSESDLELIQYWVADTQVRWGKSAVHKKELGLAEFNANTWQATLDRLFMGYAVGNDDFVDEILPYRDIEGSSAQALGGFNDYIQLLFKASEELKQATTLSIWVTRLFYYADQLLCSSTPKEQIERQQLNKVLEELSISGEKHVEKVSIEVITAWLKSRMSEQKSSTGFLRGQLTFCSMLPMRSIPFQVIALLGLNESEFPHIDRQPNFDLINQSFRSGDRSRRIDDRYQFLEVLLSARQQLIMTYIGQSIHTNKDIPASVVISELLDVLTNDYHLSGLVTKHPLQAFSQHYYSEKSGLNSFSETGYETAVKLLEEKQAPELWWQGVLETKDSKIIDMDDLFDFFRQPQEHFLKNKLGIRFNFIEKNNEEREPFAINTLDDYAINNQWVEQEINNTPFTLDKIQAQGRWLPGVTGELKFSQHQQAIDLFIEQIKQQGLGQKNNDQTIDLIVGDYRLIGRLAHVYEKGSLFYRYANLKGKDLICTLLHHLIINQCFPQNTHLLSKDEALVIPSSYSSAKNLTSWIEIYLQGRQQPSSFLTEPAFAYVKQALKLKTSKVKKSPVITAQEQLQKDLQYSRSMRLLYQNSEDLSELFNKTFETLCNDLLLPVWEEINIK